MSFELNNNKINLGKKGGAKTGDKASTEVLQWLAQQGLSQDELEQTGLLNNNQLTDEGALFMNTLAGDDGMIDQQEVASLVSPSNDSQNQPPEENLATNAQDRLSQQDVKNYLHKLKTGHL
jgi:hypothetical protein